MSDLEKQLYRVRPALLATCLKSLFGVQRRLATTVEGLQFLVDPVSHFGREILDTGTYEPDMVDILQKLLRPGDTFFDAGVNEGFFSCLAAKFVGPQGKVIGVEPQKRLIPLINKNFALNQIHHARVEPVALSDRHGSSVLYLGSGINSGTTSIYRIPRLGTRRQYARATTLDAVWKKFQLEQVRFLKVDVEGAEGSLLEGAQATLAQQRLDYLMVEWHPQITGPSIPKAGDSRLRQAGYQLMQLANGGWLYHLPHLAPELESLGPLKPVPAI